MKVTQAASEAAQAALALLRLTESAADVFPPLKAAAGGALHIAGIVMKFKSNKKDWATFGKYVGDALACVIGSLPDASEPREDLKRNLTKLQETLKRIEREIKELRDNSVWKRAWDFTKDPDKILGMKEELNNALSLFQLGSSLSIGLDVAEILKGVDVERLLQRVVNKLSEKIDYLVLNTLPYAEKASWDRMRVCLDGTRTALLDDVMRWITEPTSTAQILWLTDVAGAGKSVVAHTVAQLCYTQGILASSFFFDREVEGRNRPDLLFSTIARDLASHDAEVADRITLAIEGDRSLPTAPISRQFDELIAGPSVGYSSTKPVVIVADALDEGCNTDLLKILRDDIPKLPRSFRIILTSRPETDIEFYLSTAPHIQKRTIKIHGQANQKDITLYIRFRLQEVAERKRITADWPGDELSDKFVAKADGLFLWVSTVCNYLRLCNNPDNQLKWLLTGDNESDIPVQARMNKLYSDILSTCNWSDRDFAQAYRVVIGTILALKTPLSSSGLQDLLKYLHPSINVHDTLAQVGALFTGWMEEEQPIQIIHLSFHDFLTDHTSLDSKQLYINEMEHSNELALLCLMTLEQELKADTPGTGYLTKEGTTGIPERMESHISEQMWYACRFWIYHLVTVTTPEDILIDVVHNFLLRQLVHWVEISVWNGQFQKIDEVQKWVLKTLHAGADLVTAVFTADFSCYLNIISNYLSDLGRREEALEASEEAVRLYRELAGDRPGTFTPDLAKSLNNLSNRLSDLGQREVALQTIEEAVALYRQITTDHPALFTPDLAKSLSTLSLRLSESGQREAALQAIKEAVMLYRQLVADRPLAFTPDLAASLTNLSGRLSDLGQREAALRTIEEAVSLYRQLVADRPLAFMPNLAASLNNLSVHLSELGQREAALQTIEETVTLRRKLATDRPAAFMPDLAMSLNNLSIHLSDVGQREAAIQTIEEAVTLRRKLATDRPAAFMPDLAVSLNNLSIHLSGLGQREAALQAIEEAVTLRRKLATDRPAAFMPDLAASLNNLSFHLSELGQRDAALQVIEEAVALRRKLAADRPAAFMPDLAISLNNLSSRLSTLGRREAALQAIEETVTLIRKLATEHPTAFMPDLAASLNNLSIHLSDLGQRDAALQTIEEAVTLRRKLATDRPAAFMPDLAMSLNNLSLRLSDVGQREAAIQTIEEAVTLRRKLVADRPAAFTPDLAASLNNLSVHLSELGQREAALQTIEETVSLYRQLATDHPTAFTPDLAMSLNNLSSRLSDLGRRETALQAIEESVALRRKLATDHPAAFTPALAGSLNNLSHRLSDLGQRETAFQAIDEAVNMYRRLAVDRPAAFNADLANSLSTLFTLQSHSGHQNEALQAIQENVALYRQLVTGHPAAFTSKLATSLDNLARCLSVQGREEESQHVAREAIALRQTPCA